MNETTSLKIKIPMTLDEKAHISLTAGSLGVTVSHYINILIKAENKRQELITLHYLGYDINNNIIQNVGEILKNIVKINQTLEIKPDIETKCCRCGRNIPSPGLEHFTDTNGDVYCDKCCIGVTPRFADLDALRIYKKNAMYDTTI